MVVYRKKYTLSVFFISVLSVVWCVFVITSMVQGIFGKNFAIVVTE